MLPHWNVLKLCYLSKKRGCLLDRWVCLIAAFLESNHFNLDFKNLTKILAYKVIVFSSYTERICMICKKIFLDTNYKILVKGKFCSIRLGLMYPLIAYFSVKLIMVQIVLTPSTKFFKIFYSIETDQKWWLLLVQTKFEFTVRTLSNKMQNNWL